MAEKPLPQKPTVGDSVLNEELHRVRRGPQSKPLDPKDSSTQRKVPADFSFALACLGIIGVVSYLAVARLRENAAWVEHTREVIGRLNSLFSETTDAQNGHRGYAVTVDDSYLEPYLQATQNVPAGIRRLHRLTADNPGQQRRLETLAPLIDSQLAFGREVIDARRNQGFEAAQTLMLTRQGKRLHDQIRGVVEEMKSVEEVLLAEREVRAVRDMAVTEAVIIGGGVIAFGFVGLALLAIRRDFAGRRQAELALRRSEESLAVTLHSIGDAVLATDTAGRITRINRVAEQLTGWTHAETEGRFIGEVFRIINEETRASAPMPVNDVLATGEIHGLANHTVLIARDGTERAIADSAAPIRDKDDRLLGVVLVFRDVTAVRAAKVKLAAALEDLARLKFIFDSVPMGVSFALSDPDGRKTRLINNAHLRICRLTRDQVDDLDAFVRITHSKDRPAQARLVRQLDAGKIDHYSITSQPCSRSTSPRSTPTKRGASYLATISDSARGMGRLIGDLLAFAQTGRAELLRSRVRLNELVTETQRSLPGEISGRTVAWQVALLPEVEGDAALLRQVFANLLGNAVKYTRQQNIRQ